MAGESQLSKFMPIQKALALEPAPPAMAEFTFERSLCEQLIWRRGAHLWQDERARLATLLEGSKRCGFGAAVLTVSSAGLIGSMRRDAEGMGLICGPAALPDGSEEQLRLIGAIAAEADAVLLQGAFDPDLRREQLGYLREACETVHRAGKRVIFADRSEDPLPPEQLAELPLDGLQLSERYPFTTEEAIREYGRRFCLFGRTDFSRLAERSPMELIRDAARLWELCGGKGYVFGTGDLDGRPLPYLTFISMITAVNRLKQEEKYVSGNRTALSEKDLRG